MLILPKLSAKNCEILPSKCIGKNWLAIPSHCDGTWNLAVVLLVWLWCVIFKKWQKGLDQHSNTPILWIFGSWLRKSVNFYPQSFNEKSNWISFPFVMVCETWPWYYRFGCGASYAISEKIKRILSSAPKHADFANLQQFSIINNSKGWKIKLDTINIKSDRLLYLFDLIVDTSWWSKRFCHGVSFSDRDVFSRVNRAFYIVKLARK